MSFQWTPAHSSRITKPRRTSGAAKLGLRRTASTPSSTSPRKKSTPSLPSSNTVSYDDGDEDELLDDTGVIASLADNLNFRDVPQYMEYIRNRMFSPMPEKAGMNSTRIAQVLNFRRNLSPFVTIAHIHALSPSPTKVDREIAELVQAGILRRVTIPSRGVGATVVGDGIASVREWQNLVQSHPQISDDLKAKYISTMTTNPTSTTIPTQTFTSPELSTLLTTGFLTASNTLPSTPLFPPSLSQISTSASRHPSGSLAAAGSPSLTQHIHGGTSSLSPSRPAPNAPYTLSLPNMGSHLKLLLSARIHLLALLKQQKSRAMPLSTLKERWDGAGRLVLPARTKKWSCFYGLSCDFVFEECVGAGLLEVFETRSVGMGVRLV
ncbi:hypothetical protein IAQ61_001890 [Plenodomus lingam]|uniref:Serine-threonine protein kinase 19 n=1 Tax=Leptosphaeria maculans (strain JN3 / isolate v23.1.3 / race Av1-4-5-6-7-8) TaxID=985895 RepID=E4ZGH0_LEPMJ|nr:hypothetical protein LEMA_P065160.1 [Plenodomus lingam JN3]KAH9878618.1 hypothetical protein IAQ61_001890 [Plenodomus lingam]CBX90390.1 hypothetical protein LEMA_P065160.1 [Plenodomus lingam JN3]